MHDKDGMLVTSCKELVDCFCRRHLHEPIAAALLAGVDDPLLQSDEGFFMGLGNTAGRDQWRKFCHAEFDTLFDQPLLSITFGKSDAKR